MKDGFWYGVVTGVYAWSLLCLGVVAVAYFTRRRPK